MARFVVLNKRKMKLGVIFRIKTKDVGCIIVVRRISPSSSVLAVDYAIKVIRNKKSFVVGIKKDKFDAKGLARKTRDQLRFAKKAKEEAIKIGIRAGQLAKRGGKLGLGLAIRVGKAIEKQTRPGKRKKKSKKKRRKR